MSTALVPFRIAVPDAEIDDLRTRLRMTRWPAAWSDPDWAYGIDLDFLRELCRYWADDYDWRAHEVRLNAHPQFTTTIDGANVHFLHVRSPEPDALPVIMTHGWPGSVVEFTKVIGPLTDPVAYGGEASDALHLVVPSIPGYGFSGPTPEPGWHSKRVAEAFVELMVRLGYTRYGTQGGDWGASISAWIGILSPATVAGVHMNTVPVSPDLANEYSDITDDETQALARVARYMRDGAGYGAVQSTKPHNLVGLDDSPAGLCAWIVEKFWDWSDHGGDLLASFTRDELLTDVSVYWFTRTAVSSARLYYESAKAQTSAYYVPYLDVPTGCAIFPAEIATPSRRWAERRVNVAQYSRLARGGHFAAYEVPDLFVDDVRSFFRLVR